jgi:hypothetical protein
MSFELVLILSALVVILWIVSQLPRIEAGMDQLLCLCGMPAKGDPARPSAEVEALAASGQCLDAMRCHRQQTGADLRQAMTIVDELVERGRAS